MQEAKEKRRALAVVDGERERMKSKRKRVSTIHEEDGDLREIGKKEIVRKRNGGNGLLIYLNE
jgi:hypothetical protein